MQKTTQIHDQFAKYLTGILLTDIFKGLNDAPAKVFSQKLFNYSLLENYIHPVTLL